MGVRRLKHGSEYDQNPAKYPKDEEEARSHGAEFHKCESRTSDAPDGQRHKSSDEGQKRSEIRLIDFLCRPGDRLHLGQWLPAVEAGSGLRWDVFLTVRTYGQFILGNSNALVY